MIVRNFAFGEMQDLHVQYTSQGWVGVPVTMPIKLNARMTFDELMQLGEEGQAAAVRKLAFENGQREREAELSAQGICWWLDKAKYGLADDTSWLAAPKTDTAATPTSAAATHADVPPPQGLSPEFLATLHANRLAALADKNKEETQMPATIDRKALIAARAKQTRAARDGKDWRPDSSEQSNSGARTSDQIRADRAGLVEQGRAMAKDAR